MNHRSRLIQITGFTCALFFLLVSSPTVSFAQRGTGAKGGSITRERVREEPRPTPTPTGTGIGPTIASTTPTPTPCPTPEPEPSPHPAGTKPGKFTFTYGLNAGTRPRHSEGKATTLRAGFAFSFYATRRLFFEIDNDNVVSQKVENTDRSTGIGDTTLIVGYDFVVENDTKPGVSFLYGIKLPSASVSKGLGSGEVDHLLLGIIGKTFGKEGKTYLELDAGAYLSGKGGGNGFDNIPLATGILEQTLDRCGKYKLHSEIGGSFRTGNISAELSSLNFLRIKLNDRMEWRIGGRIGITPNSPSAAFYTAIRFNGNLKNLFN